VSLPGHLTLLAYKTETLKQVDKNSNEGVDKRRWVGICTFPNSELTRRRDLYFIVTRNLVQKSWL